MLRQTNANPKKQWGSNLDLVYLIHRNPYGDGHPGLNNASAFGRSDDESGWRTSIDVDLMESVCASWAATPMLVATGGGAIVHISSALAPHAALRGDQSNLDIPGPRR